jgi:hypothetical protein
MLPQKLTGTIYVLQQLSNINLVMPPALRMPEHTDPSVGIASQPRLNSSSARKKGQPKRSCIERSEVTTEYILTLLGNFKEIDSTLAARAWMMASAIPTLRSLIAEATGLYIINTTCVQIRLNSQSVLRHLRTSDVVSELADALRYQHDCRCVLQSDAELVHHRRRAATRSGTAGVMRASKQARGVDAALRWANYYDPLDDDEPCPDANAAGVKQQRRPAKQRNASPAQRTKPKATAPLIMATWNATKLTPAKTHELLGLASKSQVLIIAVQETWEAPEKWQQPQIIADEYNYTWHGVPRVGK